MIRRLFPLFIFAFIMCSSIYGDEHRNAASTEPAVETEELEKPGLTAAEKGAEETKENATLEERMRHSRDRAIQETKEGFVFPENYGRTEVIDDIKEPLELPKGPMEELIEKPVSLHLTNADLQELLLKLAEIEGLNLIADDSLEKTSTMTLRLNEVPLRELFSYVARNMNLEFHVGANVVWVTEGTGEGRRGMKLTTRVYPLRYGMSPSHRLGDGESGGSLPEVEKASPENNDLLNALSKFLKEDEPAGAEYSFYPDYNALVVRNTRENLRLVEQLIRTFDQSPLQVLIEARFIRISQEDLFQIGVDLELETGPDIERTSEIEIHAFSRFAADTAEIGRLSIGGIIDRTKYNILIRALDSMQSTQTLSAPRVTVLNNHLASLDDSRKEYHFSEYDLQTIDLGDQGRATRLVPIGRPEELDIGIQMNVIPSIGNDRKNIILQLAPRVTTSEEPFGVRNIRTEKVDDKEVVTEGFVEVPSFIENSVTTTVSLDSGQTVLLGGSMSSHERTIEKKIPLLGSIPILGRLFRFDEKRSEPENLLIFVSATVIGPDGRFIETAQAGSESP